MNAFAFSTGTVIDHTQLQSWPTRGLYLVPWQEVKVIKLPERNSKAGLCVGSSSSCTDCREAPTSISAGRAGVQSRSSCLKSVKHRTEWGVPAQQPPVAYRQMLLFMIHTALALHADSLSLSLWSRPNAGWWTGIVSWRKRSDRTWTWVLWTLVRCSYELWHCSRGVWCLVPWLRMHGRRESISPPTQPGTRLDV